MPPMPCGPKETYEDGLNFAEAMGQSSLSQASISSNDLTAAINTTLESGCLQRSTGISTKVSNERKPGKYELLSPPGLPGPALKIQQPDGFGPSQTCVSSYLASVSACLAGQQWSQALYLLEHMQQQGLRPDVQTYRAAVSTCSQDQQWVHSLKLLDQMQSLGLEADRAMLGNSAQACLQQKQWREALKILGKMQQQGLHSDVKKYAGQVQEVMKLQGEPDVALDELLATAQNAGAPSELCTEKSTEHKEALRLLQEMQSLAPGAQKCEEASPRGLRKSELLPASRSFESSEIEELPAAARAGRSRSFQASCERSKARVHRWPKSRAGETARLNSDIVRESNYELWLIPMPCREP